MNRDGRHRGKEERAKEEVTDEGREERRREGDIGRDGASIPGGH